jgi:6-phosphogluconolactonase
MNEKNKFDRRRFLEMMGIGAYTLLPFSDALGRPRSARRDGESYLYVGTYTSGGSRSEGIYIFRFDPETGKVTPHKTVRGVEEPSFLAIDPRGKYLFAVNETLDHQGRKSGAVSSFSIERGGSLTFLNKQPSMGGAPCHLTTSRDGRFVLVANYVGGNVAVLPVGGDGALGKVIDLEQHSGSGPNKARQESAHAHSIILDGTGHYAFANDLGIDKVMIYKFDGSNGKLSPNPDQAHYQTRPGAGPRHFKFHPSGKYAFVINELDMTISTLAYDQARGALREVNTVSTVPPGYSGENSCADVHVHPDGKFVYGSNRGHDSIAAFRFDVASGRLEPIEHVPTGGKTPRNFVIDPAGKFLLAANQRSDSIVTFSIDGESGRLKPTGQVTNVPSPVCLLFS